MLFENVVVAAIECVDAPHRITSADIEDRLASTMQRLGMRAGLLENIAGINARRYWDDGVTPSQAAALAARKAIAAAGIDPQRIGMLVNTSVCRDHLEPSTACLVHAALELPPTCLNFDLGSACVAFIDGMDVAAMMLQRGDIDYALVVDGESARYITETTIERMRTTDLDAATFRAEFASLTLGSGAVAMVLSRADLVPDGHRYIGGVRRAATQHSGLCQGNADRMVTNTKGLLLAGLELAHHTWVAAQEALQWKPEELDHLCIHQVSAVHTAELSKTLGFPADKPFLVFPEFGNVGPASVPIVLAKLSEGGHLSKGERVALLGIGSGLNCAMAEIVW